MGGSELIMMAEIRVHAIGAIRVYTPALANQSRGLRTPPVRVRVRVRCFIVIGRHKWVLCVRQRTEEVQDLHLGCGWRRGLGLGLDIVF